MGDSNYYRYVQNRAMYDEVKGICLLCTYNVMVRAYGDYEAVGRITGIVNVNLDSVFRHGVASNILI